MAVAVAVLSTGIDQKDGVNPWLIAITVTLATFMELLDTAIANVSLPHIAGGLATSYDESTWVLTSYLVANAMVLPLSAWLSRVFGRKNYYMASVALFSVSAGHAHHELQSSPTCESKGDRKPLHRSREFRVRRSRKRCGSGLRHSAAAGKHSRFSGLLLVARPGRFPRAGTRDFYSQLQSGRECGGTLRSRKVEICLLKHR